MKKKKGNQYNKILIFLCILIMFVLSSTYFFYVNNSNRNYGYNTDLPSDQYKQTYKSQNLKFTIELPKGYQVEDQGIRVLISNSVGAIIISRNGTEFNDLSSYLDNFDNSTNLIKSKDENMKISGLDSRVRVFENSDVSLGVEKIYFIYVDNAIYKISTTIELLFDDLDQIAKSFQYTP